MAVGDTTTVTVNFTDPDGDALIYAASSSNSRVIAVSMDGRAVTVAAAAQGAATITVTASDPDGLSARLSFLVIVIVPNRWPTTVGTIADQSVFVGDEAKVRLAPYFIDPDGDTLMYRVSSSESGVISVLLEDSVLTVSAIAQGTASVTVTATDPGGLAARLTFRVTVPNRAPVVTAIPDQTVFLGEITTIDLSLYLTDPDGDALTFDAYKNAYNNNVDISADSNSGMLTVRGLRRGTTIITVTASDYSQLSAETTFLVTVPNRAPTATAISDMSVPLGEQAVINLSLHFSDPDGDPLYYRVFIADNRIVSSYVGWTSGIMTITARSPGTTTITVIVSDYDDLSAQTTFRVTVPASLRGISTVPRGGGDTDKGDSSGAGPRNSQENNAEYAPSAAHAAHRTMRFPCTSAVGCVLP